MRSGKSHLTAQGITLYSCYYGNPEPFNMDIFGEAVGSYRCVVFTDNPNLCVPEGVSLSVDPLRGLDPNRASRRAKLMPHRFLEDTSWSIYIDNNAQIRIDPMQLIDSLKGRSEFLFTTTHPSRNCTYTEAKACIKAKKDNPNIIRFQMRHYRSLGFPEGMGLIHGAFLVRRHDHSLCQEFGDHWFEHVLAYSRRDQLSARFLAWHLGVGIGYISQSNAQNPVFDWPVFSTKMRRDNLAAKFLIRKSAMNILGKILAKYRRPLNSTLQAEGLAKQMYQDQIGANIKYDLDGATLLKYEKDGQFNYETYREIQSEANRLKLDSQWVKQDQIILLSKFVLKYGSMANGFGICHGTRSGNEQRWFAEALGSSVSIIGTDIAPSANDLANSIQWDFHEVNPDWIGKADFVYSNSWDHSYDPKKAFSAWIGSLRPGGVLLLDWSAGHSQDGVTEMDPFGASIEYLEAFFASEFKKSGKIVATEKANFHEHQQIYTLVFKKFDMNGK